MNGKLIAGGIVAAAIVMGAGLWYTNQYAYYRTVTLGPDLVMTMVPKNESQPVPVQADDFKGIDADSSPIRFRACFTVATPLPELTARYTAYPKAEPLLAPHWFSCFSAKTISLALKAGAAKAFLAQKGVAKDVDRVIAVFPDGRAFAWQQLDPSVSQDTSSVE
ncbi:MAG: histidine kinase [Paracoccaceae bacterium]|nr:histidine kinase [Paracoccaceae bacterium]MDE3123460.1 histidine kinase [Paracoccaceae bacterium]MDE3237805.1 histidine kinase [Paracoccaceae bacterium]